MELKDHREEGRSEPQGRGKSRREERDDGPVEERDPPHAQRPRGPADYSSYLKVLPDLFREFKDEKSGLEYMVWANLSKNSRRKNVTFESTGVKVELTSEQCKDDAGLRVYYTKEDNFDILIPQKLDPEIFPDPVEPEEPEPEPEEEVPSATSVIEDSDQKKPPTQPGSKKASRAASQLSALDAAEVGDGAEDGEEEADTEETLKPERFGLDGKNGVGGVWHIDFLTVPDGPKKINNWNIQRYYENELKTCPVLTPDESGPGIEIKLPIPEGVADKKSLEVGIWNKLTRKWETEDISINEQKDGSIFFCTKQTGAFRFFIGKCLGFHAPGQTLVIH